MDGDAAGQGWLYDLHELGMGARGFAGLRSMVTRKLFMQSEIGSRRSCHIGLNCLY